MTSEASSSALTSATFNDFNSRLQINALKTTKTGLALPNDVAFYRSMDSEFAKELDNFSSRVLSLANKVITFVATADTTSSRAKVKAKLENQDDIVDSFHLLVDICLDEFSGRMKAPAITLNPVPQVTKVMKTVTLRGHLDPVIQHASHILKPQLSFRRKVENNDLPWYPSLSHKYNAQVPLGYEFHDSDADPASPIATHPYRYEIVHLRYPERIFEPVVPLPPKDFSDTPFTWVSTSDGLQAMLAKLRQASEIAVDLEHHDYRSYAGFVCLMQISTRDEDYIIDTLALREELVELNEIFTEQSIVKVFHGAESDIVWLQQDFNIYVVNLFDTFHASKSLDFPRHGLANLLEMYCDFIPDKRYQLADWRIRPLPKEMLEYARSDTHFLLYIYDNLRNALLDRAQSRAQSRAESRSPSGSPPRASTTEDTSRVLIKQVLAKSMETSLRTYEKEVYDAEGGTGSNGWDTLARKWNKGALLAGGPDVGVSALQRAVYQAVHKWREMVARMDDESTRYVLANHFLFQLAEQPPADMAALLGVFRSVPPVIRKYAKELLEVIRDCVKRHSLSGTTPSAPGVTLHPPVPQGTESSTVPQTKSNETPLPSLWTRSQSICFIQNYLDFIALWRDIDLDLQHTSIIKRVLNNKKFISENGHSYLPPHFRDVIARINSTLVSAPTMPRVAESNIETVPENGPEDAQVSLTEVSGMQVEVPFVPASQRRVVQVTEDDSIVVVGQARQRKRKRTKLTTDGLAEASSLKNEHKNKDGRAQDDVNNHEPFDFTAVPNILDDNPNVEDMKQKKQKRQKKQKTGGTFYGDFPAPPKAHSELKRGNQSYTFK
ncbi:hypothetical protein C0989_012393 [Termitomyces sp. Mn162]|nr:hypothetical protein C0989_012393 [Termitomyces sp. Mn162]